MTTDEATIHLRQMRDELQARVNATNATAKRRQGLPQAQRETYLTRINALNTAMAVIILSPVLAVEGLAIEV